MKKIIIGYLSVIAVLASNSPQAQSIFGGFSDQIGTGYEENTVETTILLAGSRSDGVRRPGRGQS